MQKTNISTWTHNVASAKFSSRSFRYSVIEHRVHCTVYTVHGVVCGPSLRLRLYPLLWPSPCRPNIQRRCVEAAAFFLELRFGEPRPVLGDDDDDKPLSVAAGAGLGAEPLAAAASKRLASSTAS